MFFLDGEMKPSIVPRKGKPAVGVCGICEGVSWMVAKDKATGSSICQECIHDALTIDCFLVSNSKLLKIRHPKPREFRGVNDH